MKKERVLVVGAHVDDESFGMLGTLLKLKEDKQTLGFLWFTKARNTLQGVKKLTMYFKPLAMFVGLKDQELDTYPLVHIIKEVETAIQIFKPTIVYCPFIGDLNKDHRIVSEATQVACRPYLPNAPKAVWMYSIPGSTNLGIRPFMPDVSQKIDVKKKKSLITKWYPGEIMNGRDVWYETEEFEKCPSV